MTTPANKARLILSLRSAGSSNITLLSAIERIPREYFVPETFRDQSYENIALPIGYGQTLSQPLVVASMIEALEVNNRVKLLELGTGSGYHASILALLCRRVYTIERHRPLLAEAESRFKKLDLNNITTKAGDGMKGWPEQSPFERISVTAASDSPPSVLLEQLAIGGIMIIPIGGPDRTQVLTKIRRTEQGFDTEDLMKVRFVPLVSGLAEN